MEFIAYFGIYFLIGGWAIYAAYYLRKRLIDSQSVNQYLAEAIPGVFTTLGVVGTFVGIAYGLWYFDVEDIDSSIPQLLNGLKTAFISSIIGIILSLIFGRIGDWVVKENERKVPPKPSDELDALLQILTQLKENEGKTKAHFEQLTQAMVGESDRSLATYFDKLRSQISDQAKDAAKQIQIIADSLGGDQETSLLTQVQRMRTDSSDHAKANNKYAEVIIEALGGDEDYSMLSQLTNLRDEQKDIGLEANEHTEQIILAMKDHNKVIQKKFDEFSDLLAKNNTEALVEAMQRVITDFNTQMNELIQRLVKENFQELNKSVQRLNDWQKENKEQVGALIRQFTEVSENLQISSHTIKEIAENTKSLTDDNGHLKNLIKELQDVMIEDTKFKEITEKVGQTIDTLKGTSDDFEETTNKLNTWIREEKNFKDSVDILIERLKEIEKIKEINGAFWGETRSRMNEGVSIIAGANQRLEEEVNHLNAEFYARLNDTFQSLDTLIQRFITNGRAN